MRITNALAGYALQLEADGRSRHTVAQARRHVRLLIQAVGDREVASLRPEDLAAFLASPVVTRRADGGPRRPTSANALRSSLRCFFAFVHAAGYAGMNPARLIRRARCAPPRPKGLSAGDTAKLLVALDGARTLAERRDRALFRTMLGLGLRVGSVVALDVEDLDLDAAELRVRALKNQDQDLVYLTDDLVALLRSYVAGRASGPLFPRGDGGRIGCRQVGRRLEVCSPSSRYERNDAYEVRERCRISAAVGVGVIAHEDTARRPDQDCSGTSNSSMNRSYSNESGSCACTCAG